MQMPNEKYTVIKLSDNSWRIEDNMVRTFLFEGRDNALLVDTGFGTGNIKEEVEKLTRKPVILVNTHGDDDHIGCNRLFEKARMHPSEFAYYFEKVQKDSAVSPLWEGDIIDIGTRKFEIIHIPGHTAGSIALLDRVNRLLVSGDSISDSPIFMFGKTRNMNAFISSMNKLERIKNTFDTIYPSHGSFPVKPDKIGKLSVGASGVLNGEIKGEKPPFVIPARIFVTDGAAFFY